MNFRQATDELIEGVTLEDLAKALGVHVQAVRQARAIEGSAAYRRPPANWEAATAKLANARAKRLERLVARLGTPS